MATFKAVVKTKSQNDTYKVYIRVTQSKRHAYLDTGMQIVAEKAKGGNIQDKFVKGKCDATIFKYMEKLNKENSINWSLEEVVKYITEDTTKISFYSFCEQYIAKIVSEGRKRPAQNYELALNSFRNFCGKDLSFQDIKSNMINEWIASLKKTARSKQLYPTLVKAMFNAGKKEFNDYDNDRIRISHSPFENVKIPKADVAVKKAVEVAVIQKLLTVKPDTKRSELAQDVAKLIIYLVGINTVDLFETKKDCFIDRKLCYNRSKTKDSRRDKAYIEIKVKDEILYLFDKYKGEGDKLFDFGYKDSINFYNAVNRGLKCLCKLAGVEKLTSYAFRHSWATIAHNDCGAEISLVGLCLNHASDYAVTRLYVKNIFDVIDELNNKVLDFIFNTKDDVDDKNKEGEKRWRKKNIVTQ